jgi:hypothetical protein
MSEPTPEDEERMTEYTDILLHAADKLANKPEFAGVGGGIEAVLVLVRNRDGWGGHRCAGPEEWGEAEELGFLLGAAKSKADQMGIDLKISNVGSQRIRPMPRNRNRRHRRR